MEYKNYIKNQSFIFLLSFTVLLTSCNGEGNQVKEEIKSYEVKTLKTENAVLYDEYPAVIQGQQEVEIRSKIDGYIEKIYVDEGGTVKKGQTLFKIFSPQYEQELRTAEAGIKTAEAEVNTATMELNKVKPLVEKEIISNYSLEAAQYNLQSKKAVLRQAQATLENARANVGYTAITSPTDGVIGKLPYKVGSLVSSSSPNPLTTVVSSGNTYAYFSLNEKQLLEISRNFIGATMQEKLKSIPPVSFVLADGSLYDQQGIVKTASGIISTETGSIDLRATFPNASYMLKSGSSGRIRMERTVNEALIIPQSSTYDLQGKRFIYVLKKDNTVKNTPLTVTPTPDGKFFIVQDGLKAGDKIVLEGSSELKDGNKISPRQI